MNSRRLSQAISEGDGISVIVEVDGPEAARDAEDGGADALLVPPAAADNLGSIRGASDLPILATLGEHSADALEGADACLVDVRDDDRERLRAVQRKLADRFELALRIEAEDHLEFVLEELDPEILVLAASTAERRFAARTRPRAAAGCPGGQARNRRDRCRHSRRSRGARACGRGRRDRCGGQRRPPGRRGAP